MARETVTNGVVDDLGVYVPCCAQIFFSRNMVKFDLYFHVKYESLFIRQILCILMVLGD